MTTKAKHPGFVFETGYRITTAYDNHFGVNLRHTYCVAGRLDDGTPFCLDYGIVTHWDCPVTLGDGMRRKILEGLRRQIRFQDELPAYMVNHDFSDRRFMSHMPDDGPPDPLSKEIDAIRRDFWDDVWRDQYLDDRDSDYLLLAVPFSEKDEAKAAGAEWNSRLRSWWVKQDKNLSRLERWMKPADAGPIAPTMPPSF